MKIYKEYYVSVKPDSELAYVLPLTGSEKKIVEQQAFRASEIRMICNVRD